MPVPVSAPSGTGAAWIRRGRPAPVAPVAPVAGAGAGLSSSRPAAAPPAADGRAREGEAGGVPDAAAAGSPPAPGPAGGDATQNAVLLAGSTRPPGSARVHPLAAAMSEAGLRARARHSQGPLGSSAITRTSRRRPTAGFPDGFRGAGGVLSGADGPPAPTLTR